MAFNLNNGNQTAQSRLKKQKENDSTQEQAMPDARRVPIDMIRSNPFQVRQDFDSEEAQKALKELAEDIRQRDILEPLVVRPIQIEGQDFYEIVAGERRYRAAKLAQKIRIPVIVKENWSEKDARLASLSENLQRRDLSLIEEVQFFQLLESEYNWSANRIAELINRSESYVSRRLRLAKDPAKLAELSRENITLGEMLLRRHEQTEQNPSAPGRVTERTQSDKPSANSGNSRKLSGSVRLVAVTRFRETLDRLAEPRSQSSLTTTERIELLHELDGIQEQIANLRTVLQNNKPGEKSHK